MQLAIEQNDRSFYSRPSLDGQETTWRGLVPTQPILTIQNNNNNNNNNNNKKDHRNLKKKNLRKMFEFVEGH